MAPLVDAQTKIIVLDSTCPHEAQVGPDIQSIGADRKNTDPFKIRTRVTRVTPIAAILDQTKNSFFLSTRPFFNNHRLIDR